MSRARSQGHVLRPAMVLVGVHFYCMCKDRLSPLQRTELQADQILGPTDQIEVATAPPIVNLGARDQAAIRFRALKVSRSKEPFRRRQKYHSSSQVTFFLKFGPSMKSLL